MADACPILTPEERKIAEILKAAERAMLETVHAAVEEAAARVRDTLHAVGLDPVPPPSAYFDAVVHQQI